MEKKLWNMERSELGGIERNIEGEKLSKKRVKSEIEDVIELKEKGILKKVKRSIEKDMEWLIDLVEEIEILSKEIKKKEGRIEKIKKWERNKRKNERIIEKMERIRKDGREDIEKNDIKEKCRKYKRNWGELEIRNNEKEEIGNRNEREGIERGKKRIGIEGIERLDGMKNGGF